MLGGTSFQILDLFHFVWNFVTSNNIIWAKWTLTYVNIAILEGIFKWWVKRVWQANRLLLYTFGKMSWENGKNSRFSPVIDGEYQG